MGSPYKFPSEFKSNAAAYYLEHKGEITKAQAAANLGVSLSALDRWTKDPRYTGGDDRKVKAVKAEQSSAKDLVHSEFKATAPNALWFADITYVKTYECWLYLAVVFDVFSRRVVGWSMDTTMEAKIVDDALKMGIKRCNPPKGLIHHSDHGSQYRSLLLDKTLRAHGTIPSMGAIASPWDNAITESLMSTIKAECTDIKTYDSVHAAKIDIFNYLEVFYNKLRMHSALGMMSPLEFEERYYRLLDKAS